MSRDLDASLKKLYALRTFGIKPGLEPVRALLAGLDDPQLAFAAIHVAGTNGKGSVAVMLDAVLRAAGFRVGLYTSPHLVRFNERIRVNGVAIADEALADLFDAIEPVAAGLEARGVQATFFEVTTAMAFEHFRRERVQLAVVETGLGGRLDATNVVMPLMSVITRVDFDHMAHLGDTIEAIAGEKAGIVKEGRPVICGAMPAPAREVVRRAAGERHAVFVDAAETVAVRRVSQSLAGQKLHLATEMADYGTVTLRLLGRHQLENVATVMAAVETLKPAGGLTIAPDVVRAGLAGARWPGRLDVLSETPPVILDGAHNPDAARALAAALKELFRRRPIGLIWGMCSDKDALGFAGALGGLVRVCWPVTLTTERSRPAGELGNIARSRGWEVRPAALPEALDQAQAWAARENGVVCIAGSLYLAGEVLALRQGTQSMPI